MKRRTIVKSLGLAGLTQLSALTAATSRKDHESIALSGGWEHRFQSPSITQPMTDSDNVYVGTGSNVAALGKETGDVVWETSLSGGHAISSGVLREGGIVVPTFQSLFRLDSSSGSVAWERHIGTGQNTAPIYADGNAIIANGRDYRGGSPAQLTAIDVITGTPSWSLEVDGDIEASPSLNGTKLYFGSTNGTVYRVETTTGEVDWKQSVDHVVNTTPLVGDSSVYVHDELGEFYVLDIADGTITEQRSLSAAWDGFKPVFAGKNVVTAGRNGVYGLGQTGELKWSTETVAPAMPLYPADSAVYYGDTEGDIYRVDGASGQRQQLLSFDPYWPGCEDTGYQGIAGPPVVDGGRLYVAVNGGKVTSIDTNLGA